MAFPRRRLVVCLLLAAAAVTVAYWAAWYGHRSWVASRTESSYEDFENAFPLADGWLVVTLLVAARGLLLRRPSALLGLLCAGSAGLYLAGMDVLYDLQHGIWWDGGGGGVLELGINLVTLAGSAFALGLGWRYREALIAGG
jgi:hypothetical protein